MASSGGVGGSPGPGMATSGGSLHKKKSVKDVLRVDKKSVKKYAQRKRGY